MRAGFSRRDFVKGATAAFSLIGAASYGAIREASQPATSSPERTAQSHKLNVACIGVGGKGGGDVNGVAGENIVALCDVDDKQAAKTFKKYPKVKKYNDYRRMFEEMDKQIDAVTVSTPDHTHFPAAMMAISMGKHVFVQKPMAHTIWEARQLTEAARRQKVATQMGIQGHAGEGARLIREWIQAGAIGPVHEVHYWTNRPTWPQGIDRPADTPPAPATLDWNLWLGTAPERPYNPCYAPKKWRGWWDFGCGALGDIGCHAMDAAFWALDLGHPISVEAETSELHKETAPKWSIVTYQFPARGKMPPVKVVWYDGKRKPPRPPELEEGRELNKAIGGQLIYGEKGTLMADVYGKSPRLIPESKMREFLPNRPPQTIPRSPGHMTEWIEACKGGKTAGANFDYSGPLTEMVLLGNLAVRASKKIEWDAANMKAPNAPEAEQYIRLEHRKF